MRIPTRLGCCLTSSRYMRASAQPGGGRGFGRLGGPPDEGRDDAVCRLEIVEALLEADARGEISASAPLIALLRHEQEPHGPVVYGRPHRADIAGALRSLKRRLYPYQRDGVRRFLAAGRLVLAADMGLGKTAPGDRRRLRPVPHRQGEARPAHCSREPEGPGAPADRVSAHTIGTQSRGPLVSTLRAIGLPTGPRLRLSISELGSRNTMSLYLVNAPGAARLMAGFEVSTNGRFWVSTEGGVPNGLARPRTAGLEGPGAGRREGQQREPRSRRRPSSLAASPRRGQRGATRGPAQPARRVGST